jgi:hypothetical protein
MPSLLDRGTLTAFVVAPHRHGLTSIIEHSGQGPVWHLLEQTCSQSDNGFRQVDSHDGIGSEHVFRGTTVSGGKNEMSEDERACLPQGQCVISDGERGHDGGENDGG